jgi:hypothetical protein
MRVVWYHGIVNSSEISASEKHEMKMVQENINPQSAHMYQCKGNRRTRKCSELHEMSRHFKYGYFVHKILFGCMFQVCSFGFWIF